MVVQVAGISNRMTIRYWILDDARTEATDDRTSSDCELPVGSGIQEVACN